MRSTRRHGLGWLWAAVLLGGCGTAPQPPAQPKIETRKTIGKTTQNVLPLDEALADGGVLAATSVTSEGLEVYADAYRTSVAAIAGIAVQQKMQLYAAEHGTQPATYQEFMSKIIEKGSPNGVQLPMLPYYQEYAFDPATRSLVVVEFPAKKEQRARETTGAAGL